MELTKMQAEMAASESSVKGDEQHKPLDAEDTKPKNTEAGESKLEEETRDAEPLSYASVIDEKRPSFKEESNFLPDLKEHEKKALQELKSKLEEAIVEGKLLKVKDEEAYDLSIWGVPLKDIESTNVLLLKFLRAREFKVKDAFEMLQNTLQWRKENRVDSILDEDDLGAKFGKVGFISGVDREGHPICYNILGAFQDAEICNTVFGSEEGRKKFLRWRVQLMEQGIKELDMMRPGGVSSLLHVTDLKDSLGFSKKETKDTIRQVVQLLQDNYPEFVARNVVINAPFWFYALNALISPFLTQRTKSKFVVVRPAKVTETLLKYISLEAIPTQYGGLKSENDIIFSNDDGKVSELFIKASSSSVIEIPANEIGATILWELVVLAWDVSYKAEFVPTDDGSYTVIVQKGKKIGGSQEEPIRSSFRNNEPGKIFLTIENNTLKKKRVFYRYRVKRTA